MGPALVSRWVVVPAFRESVLLGLGERTGKLRWRLDLKGSDSWITSPMVRAENLLVMGTNRGEILALKPVQKKAQKDLSPVEAPASGPISKGR